MTRSTIKTNRVLALSGGGVKGIAELVILAEIEKRTEKKITELFTIISGTSVGGLIAALLTIPKEYDSKEPKYSATKALEIFKSEAPKIFPKVVFPLTRQIVKSKYKTEPLRKILNKHLENIHLSNSTSRLIIPVTNLETNIIEVFDSNAPYSKHIQTKNIVEATTAAPTYFKPVTNHPYIKSYENKNDIGYAYADGGIGANRPAPEVLQILMKCNTEEDICIRGTFSRDAQKAILDHTMIVALDFEEPIEQNPERLFTGTGGFIDWILGKNDLINKILNISQNISTSDVKRLLPNDGEFIEILIPITKETYKLDNANKKNIEALEQIAKQYINEHNDFINTLCNDLLFHYNNSQPKVKTQKFIYSTPPTTPENPRKAIGKHTESYLKKENSNQELGL